MIVCGVKVHAFRSGDTVHLSTICGLTLFFSSSAKSVSYTMYPWLRAMYCVVQMGSRMLRFEWGTNLSVV